jgi:hypothetical protein
MLLQIPLSPQRCPDAEPVLCADVLVPLREQHMLGTLGYLQAAGLHLRAARHSLTAQML